MTTKPTAGLLSFSRSISMLFVLGSVVLCVRHPPWSPWPCPWLHRPCFHHLMNRLHSSTDREQSSIPRAGDRADHGSPGPSRRAPARNSHVRPVGRFSFAFRVVLASDTLGTGQSLRSVRPRESRHCTHAGGPRPSLREALGGIKVGLQYALCRA